MPGQIIASPNSFPGTKELFFQLLSRLGAELPPNEGENPIARLLGTDPYTPDDEPYLRQYMGISKDGGLTPTDIRPTKVKVDDDLSWYRPSSNPFDAVINGKPAPPIPAHFVERLLNGESTVVPTGNVPGLGHFIASVAKNSKGNPYLSVYDKWDFDSSVVSPIMRVLMGRVGKGFHTYERYPLKKTLEGYRPGGDIELFPEK